MRAWSSPSRSWLCPACGGRSLLGRLSSLARRPPSDRSPLSRPAERRAAGRSGSKDRRTNPTPALGNRCVPGRVRSVMTTIGFIGSGNIGSTVARLAVDAGYDVVLSNSRGPETLADLVAELGPKARAATSAEAAADSDLVVLTIPLGKVDQVAAEPLIGKTIIDTCNYYPQRDGQIAALDEGRTTTSSLVQDHFAQSHVVKAF